jgi:uncharacterized protein YqgC (DUF456 family)
VREPFWLWQVLTWTLLLAGLFGSLVPIPWLPGLPLVFAGIWLYGWATEFAHFGALFLVMQASFVVLGFVLDYAASAVGTKKFGGSRAGAWGAFVGGLLGLFFMPIGLIVGPFAGAIVGELIAGQDFSNAVRSGWGALAGLCGGVVIKVIIAFIMIGLFLWTI